MLVLKMGSAVYRSPEKVQPFQLHRYASADRSTSLVVLEFAADPYFQLAFRVGKLQQDFQRAL